MIRTWSSRLGALAIGMLLLGGGSGLPVLDALLHHWRISQASAQVHLLDPNARATHAERCTLGTALPALVVAAGTSAMAVGVQVPEGRVEVRPAELLSTHFHSRDCRPRAPPVSPV
jgi:hypothetical protein